MVTTISAAEFNRCFKFKLMWMVINQTSSCIFYAVIYNYLGNKNQINHSFYIRINDKICILFWTILRHFCIFLSAIRLQSVTDNVRLLNGSPQFLSVYESQSQHLMANAIVKHSFFITSLKYVSRFHLQVCNIISTNTPT